MPARLPSQHSHWHGLNISYISLFHRTTNASSGYSVDDVFILPDLKTLSMVRGLKWPLRYVISDHLVTAIIKRIVVHKYSIARHYECEHLQIEAMPSSHSPLWYTIMKVLALVVLTVPCCDCPPTIDIYVCTNRTIAVQAQHTTILSSHFIVYNINTRIKSLIRV